MEDGLANEQATQAPEEEPGIGCGRLEVQLKSFLTTTATTLT